MISAYLDLKVGDNDGRNLDELETPVWTPDSPLTDRQIDQVWIET